VARNLHTPARLLRLLAPLSLAVAPVAFAQTATAATTGTLLDAFAITVRADTTVVARGTIRRRVIRIGTELEISANGIVVRGAIRTTAELRTDTAGVLRRYLAETRDSTNRVIDRVQVSVLGGRLTVERVTPTRRSAREFFAPRNVMIVDTTALIPMVALAAAQSSGRSTTLLDVRGMTSATLTLPADSATALVVGDTRIDAWLSTLRASPSPLRLWRDARGRLLGAVVSARTTLQREEPPI
jgi:hypothetical protein